MGTLRTQALTGLGEGDPSLAVNQQEEKETAQYLPRYSCGHPRR